MLFVRSGLDCSSLRANKAGSTSSLNVPALTVAFSIAIARLVAKSITMHRLLTFAPVLSLLTNFGLAQTTPPACPASNGIVYNAPSGAQFLIECDVDHQAGDMDMTWVDTFEDCIVACDENEGCVDVSMSGSACMFMTICCKLVAYIRVTGYMKSTLGLAQPANGILGARLMSSSPTSDSVPTASATPSISCPGSNGTTYTSNTYARFTVECGIDHAAGDMAMQYVADLTACVQLCDTTEDCVAVALSANACYLKSEIGAGTPNQGLSGAVLTTPRPTCPSTAETWTAENGLVFAVECDIGEHYLSSWLNIWY